MHLNLLEYCYRFWLYFMLLKPLAQSSIIAITYSSFLDMSLNFEFEISMLSKLILVVWCEVTFHPFTPNSMR